MFGAVEQEGLRWPDLTREQMGHLMVYLQAEPTRDPEPDPRRGQAVLVRKGCLKCHQLRGEGGSVAIDLGQARAGFESAVAWATMVWNHAPRMAQHAARLGVLYPRFAGDEMSQLVLFLRSVSASR
jgi:cytochrome c